jgi:formylglycine-generating enzyme required for sulfatase activity
LGVLLLAVDVYLASDTARRGATNSLVASNEIIKSIGLSLSLIPAGEFLMGSPDSEKDANVDEKPQHRVRFNRPFYLGVTEVTVGQFRRVVDAAGYRTEAERDAQRGQGWNEEAGTAVARKEYNWRNPGFSQTDEHPVVNVSWNDAVAFCNLLSELQGLRPYYLIGSGTVVPAGGIGYRLPTEAEWEYACRARTTTPLVTGDNPEMLALVGNIADGTARARYPDWGGTIAARDGFVWTAPTRRFLPNAFGLFDMIGNVSEWCWDWYLEGYAGPSDVTDPHGPTEGKVRLNRGADWRSGPPRARSANRNGSLPDQRYLTTGFRVARCVAPGR